jgi:3-dehydroquinate synthase
MSIATVSATVTTVSVALAGSPKTYPIFIGDGVLAQLPHLLQTYVLNTGKQGKVLIVTDSTVATLYLAVVQNSLQTAGITVETMIVPAGEQAKSAEQLQRIYEACHTLGMTRKDVLLALGGGVVGDLTGYAAATYYRGCQFVQVPTTLLAQVDSSVGGKVAINFKDVKNAIGTFYQPSLVVADTACIATLPHRERLAGLAEMLKYALIEQSAMGDKYSLIDADSFLTLYETLGTQWMTQLPVLIAKCCQLKAAVVARDEQETAAADDATGRVCLNLGHTFAHAYEASLGYGVLLHGEAVAIGLQQAFWLSQQLGLVTPQTYKRILTLMKTLELFPIVLPKAIIPTSTELIALMQKDKKVLSSDSLRLILPCEPIGTLLVKQDANKADVEVALAQYPVG